MTEAIMKSQNDFLFPIAYHLDNYFSKWYIQYTYNVDYWMQYRSFDRLLFTALHSIKRDVKLLLIFLTEFDLIADTFAFACEFRLTEVDGYLFFVFLHFHILLILICDITTWSRNKVNRLESFL